MNQLKRALPFFLALGLGLLISNALSPTTKVVTAPQQQLGFSAQDEFQKKYNWATSVRERARLVYEGQNRHSFAKWREEKVKGKKVVYATINIRYGDTDLTTWYDYCITKEGDTFALVVSSGTFSYHWVDSDADGVIDPLTSSRSPHTGTGYRRTEHPTAETLREFQSDYNRAISFLPSAASD